MSHAPAEPQRILDVIESNELSKKQWIYFILIFCLLLTEGMDGTLVSHVFPSLIKDWGVSIGGGIALVVSGGFIAMGIGAFTAGRLSDQWGRKSILVASGMLMAVATVAGATAENFNMFTFWRLLACLGIGAVLPTAFTLLSDLVPKKRRGAMLAASYAGVGLGSALGATLAGLILPIEGWRALMVAGGVVPLAVVIIVWIAIPESPSFFVARRLPTRARRSLERMFPQLDLAGVDYSAPELVGKASSDAFRRLLSRPFAPRTVMLWVFGFVSLGLLMLTNQYLPILLQLPSPGLTTVESSTIVAVQGLGGVVGILIFSLVLLKWRNLRAISVYLGISAILTSVVGLLADAGFGTLLLALTAMALFMPALLGPTRNILAVDIYPDDMRATGVGATELSARLGSASQGALGGVLIGGGLGLGGFFFALLLPLGILGATLVGLRLLDPRKRQQDDAQGPEQPPTPFPDEAQILTSDR